MPPLKPGKVVNSKGNIETKKVAPKKVDPETARETRRLPPKKVDPETARETRRIAPKPPKFVGFDPSSTIGKSKDYTTVTSKPKKDKGGGLQQEQQISVISAPLPTGIVDNVNVKEKYETEARRIILSLVKSAKDLLIKYNFSSINRVAEYALDSDAQAKTEYVVASKARPEPPFTLSQADLQDKFSQDITNISNSISDTVEDIVKFGYFGTIRSGIFYPKTPKISGGSTFYDMKLEINSVCGKDFIVKCYEIS